MRKGFLLVEIHADRPGLVRIRAIEHCPDPPPWTKPSDSGSRVLYAARFADLDTAVMHAHAALRRGLIDIDSRLYRAEPLAAVAATDTIGLSHRQVYLDPELAGDPEMQRQIDRRQRRKERIDRIWKGVGVAALMLLALMLLLSV
jgi:hypothetical protein